MVDESNFDQQRNLAVSLFNQGKLVESMELSEQLCAYREDAAVYCLLGVIWGRMGRFARSATSCGKAIELVPDYTDAHMHLGYALRRLNDFQNACKALEFVISRHPDNYQARYQLGLARESAGDYRGALACFEAVRLVNPDFLDAIAGEASVYDRLGEPERALEILRPFIDARLRNAQIAVQYGRIARGMGLQNEAVDMLESLVADLSFPADERLQIHFTLGALCDDLNDYDRAFEHYHKANGLKGVRCDRAHFHGRVEILLRRFARDKLARAARASNHSGRPVFVVGMPRSGTSLVEQILSSHPDVFGAGELLYVGAIVSGLERSSTDITQLSVGQLDQAAGEYLQAIGRIEAGARHVVDKLPGNFLHLGYIDRVFPGARIIHCRRDPLDTCLSCYMQNFAPVHAYTFNLEDMGSYYLKYRQLMEHWKQVVSLPVLEVDYEVLIAEPQQQMRRLVEFLDLPWDGRCLQFHENERIAKTASYDQVRRPIYSKSVGRWRNYERHLGVLQAMLEDES